MIKNIFFDFDGVIVDSVNVKTQAFEKLYAPYGENISQKVVEHHQANGGMSRYEKFKFYHKQFLGNEIDEKEVDKLANQFSLLVKQGVIDSPEVKGSHDFIKKYRDRFNMFVITGTPTEESIAICKARGILHYFKGIYGSPKKKEYWTKYILNEYDLNSTETIFVGDAMADYNAAMQANLRFYLRDYHENKEIFRNIGNVVRFKDFNDFENLIINK